MRKYVLAALLAGTLATPALAQEASPFTGFRVEGIVGYDSLRSGQQDDGVDTNDNQGDESIDGITFGVGAGYDFDAGGVVLGVEGEFTESTGDQDTDETIDGINYRAGVATGRDLYIGGRIGVRAAPSTLVYGKAGYTNTSIEADFEDDTDKLEFDTNVEGWRLGAGVEQLFGPNMYGKLEYRYSNYNKIEIGEELDIDRDIDLDRHQIVAGVGFRF